MRIVVAEDQFLLRDGLVRLLTSMGFEVVAAVEDGITVPELVAQHRPELVLLDIRMPPTHTDEGLRLALVLREQVPGFPVVLLSQYVELLYVDELLSSHHGGVGYLLKDRVFDARQFAASLRTVAAGGTVIDRDVVTQLMRRRRHQDVLARLSPRESEALSLMAEGHSNSEIAHRMVITERAVEKYINNLFSKLDLPPSSGGSRRVLAVLSYLRS